MCHSIILKSNARRGRHITTIQSSTMRRRSAFHIPSPGSKTKRSQSAVELQSPHVKIFCINFAGPEGFLSVRTSLVFVIFNGPSLYTVVTFFFFSGLVDAAMKSSLPSVVGVVEVEGLLIVIDIFGRSTNQCTCLCR